MERIKGLAIGTRYFDNKLDSSPKKIVELGKRFSDRAEWVIIAINVAEDKSGAMKALKELGLENLTVIGVSPWVKYVQSMNVIIDKAANKGMKYLLSLSAEVRIIEEAQIQAIMSHMADDTLCVGARLQGHEFVPAAGLLAATGTTVPWNTCCLWNLERFSLVGFPLVGDAPFDPSRKMAGVEELSAIALMQNLYGVVQNKAKLVEVPGVEWETNFCDDSGRQNKHMQKLTTKCVRPAEQLRRLGLKVVPLVKHISRE